jgi:hypothetical protein
MLIQNVKTPYGHVSMVTGIDENGNATVTESNWNNDEKVGTRVINKGDATVTGVYRGGTRKQEAQSTDPNAPVSYDQVPSNLRATVKAIAEYRQKPMARTSKAGLEAMNWVNKLNPDYDETKYNEKNTYLTQFTKPGGTNYNTRIAINTGINHLAEFKEKTDALKNKSFKSWGIFTKKYNSIRQMLQEEKGDPAVTGFNNTLNKVATELAKIYKGTASPTQDEIEAERVAMGIDLTPEQFDEVFKTSVNLVAGKLQPLRLDYQTNMGHDYGPLVDSSARASAKKLQAAGIDIDIDAIDPPSKMEDVETGVQPHTPSNEPGGNSTFTSASGKKYNLPY